MAARMRSEPWLGPRIAEAGRDAIDAFVRAGGDATDPSVAGLVATLGEHAPALLTLAVGDTSLPTDVLASSPTRAEDASALRTRLRASVATLADGLELDRELRRMRHRGVVRIALREVLKLADIDRTSAEMAHLASAVIDAALDGCVRAMESQHGRVRGRNGEAIPFVVLGMGKLGGEELNIGSDVDLCFFYETDDGTVDDDSLTVHAYFAKLATKLVRALSEVTGDGSCFRVDLRLRPEGSQGPLVNSLASAERYYETWGRTWERAVLLRAAAVAGDLKLGEELLRALRPFVYRRGVDPGVSAEMAMMLERTRRELAVDDDRDIKLGRGGIREAEFFVQALQLVWGGTHPELRVPGTVEAVRRLRSAGLVTDHETDVLETDWALLRRVEHRIHVRLGYQTHSLPLDDELERMAQSLGFGDRDSLASTIREARARISGLFHSILPRATVVDPYVELADVLASDASKEALAERCQASLRVTDIDEAMAHLDRMRRRPDSPFGKATRASHMELGPRMLAEVAGSASPNNALAYLAEFFSHVGGASGFERLFVEQPRLLRRLVALFGASPTLSEALVHHPESLAQTLLAPTITQNDIAEAHRELRAAQASLEDGASEDFVGALRRLKREVTLRIGLGVVALDLDRRASEHLLTTLADEQVAACLARATAEKEKRWGRPSPVDPSSPAAMCVIAMGSLGAKELGFGSDLDLLFVFGSEGNTEHPTESITHGEFFTRVAQLTMRLLGQPDAEGDGYEADARLRPDGTRGTLVVSLKALERYYEKAAAPWEHQALLRARPAIGDAGLLVLVRERIEHLCRSSPRLEGAAIAELRGRMQTELSGERSGRYHPKLGFGALVDIEFIAQFLELDAEPQDRVLVASTLEALDALTAKGRLGKYERDTLRSAHEFFRGVDLGLRLARRGPDQHLLAGSRDAERIARSMRIRDRGGETEGEVLVRTWREHAFEVRNLFDRIVGEVAAPPEWLS